MPGNLWSSRKYGKLGKKSEINREVIRPQWAQKWGSVRTRLWVYHNQTSTSVSPLRHLRLQHKHLAFVCPLHCVSACWKATWFSGEASKVSQSSFWKSRALLLQRRGSDVSLTIGLLDIIWGGTQIIFYCAWCVINTQKFPISNPHLSY